MNRNLYVKIMVTFLLLAVIFFGIMIVNNLNYLQKSNLLLAGKIEKLEESLHDSAWTPPASIFSGAIDNSAVPAKNNFANAEFFDTSAVSGGRMIVAVGGESGNLNPITSNDQFVSMISSLINVSLGERNYQNPEQFGLMLAESYEADADGKTFKIKLRHDVYWQDFVDPETNKSWKKVPVTAHDVVFYVSVIQNEEVNASALRTYYNDLEYIKALNDYELEVKWKTKYFRSLELTLGLMPLPRHFYYDYPGQFDGKKFNNDRFRNRMMIGCGPYQFVRWDKEQQILLERFDNYFGKQYGAMPALKYMKFDIIKQPATRLQSLLSGQIDKLSLTSEQWNSDKLKSECDSGTLKRFQYLSHAYYYIGYNLRNPLFEDKRVRQALSCLIDRKRIIKDVVQGLGQIVDGPFFYNSPYYDKTLKPYEFDVENAKKLLAEAGWIDHDGDGILDRDGVKFEFSIMQVADNPLQQKMLPLIKEDMAKAGINMKISVYEWSVYIQRLETRDYEVCTLGWTVPFEADPYQVWHSSQATINGSSNHIGFANAAADKIIEQIRSSTELAQRIKLCHEFQKIIHEEQPYTFLFAPYSLVGISGRYQNLRLFDDGIVDLILWTPKSEQKKISGF